MTEKGKGYVLISVPTHDGQVQAALIPAILGATRHHRYAFQFTRSSLLAHGFNNLFSNALEARKDGVTHFAMVHADIIPSKWWLDRMMVIMQETGATVLSGISPLKGSKGLTSTALDETDGVRRLTLRELFKSYPPTFTRENLLINTGLMLIDLSHKWIEDLFFTVRDWIEYHGDERKVCMLSEDWDFSRQVRQKGGTLWATRDIELLHYGSVGHTNAVAWGTETRDRRGDDD